jgi:hypothetical protein
MQFHRTSRTRQCDAPHLRGQVGLRVRQLIDALIHAFGAESAAKLQELRRG